jgi:hypothetical protein
VGANVSAHRFSRPAIRSARIIAANVALAKPHFMKPEVTHRREEPGR